MNTNKRGFRALSRGIGLIEIGMGLGLGGLILVMALAYFGGANMTRQVNDAMAEVGAIQNASRALIGGQSNYNGITSAVIASSRYLPNKYITAGAAGLTSSFNGPVIVVSSNTDQNFDIAITNVPRDACNRLSTSDMGTGMLAVGVGANDPTGATGIGVMAGRVATNPSMAYTAAEANAACIGALNVVAWRFN